MRRLQSTRPAALAQTAIFGQAAYEGEGLRRQEERTREQQQNIEPYADVLQPAAPTRIGTTLPEKSPCFLIGELVIEGADAWRFARVLTSLV